MKKVSLLKPIATWLDALPTLSCLARPLDHGRLVAIAFLFALARTSSFGQASSSPEAANLEAKLAARFSPSGVGEAVLVARDGKLLFDHGYGLADQAKKIPVTPETRFRIGSVTKQFTAAAILLLAEQGKLSIEDPLSKYFPSYPGGQAITLRHLLTHTSGLHNYTEHPDFLTRVTLPITPDLLVAWFQNDPPDFAPGEQFHYSNTGYVLLGQIVEKVSGQSLGDFMQQQFFTPLGLKDTGFWHNQTPPDSAAMGYSFLQGRLQPALDWDMSWAGGAGQIYSTVGDLWRWTEALQEGRVLSPSSLRTMTTEVTVTKKETLALRYTMGLYYAQIGWLPAIGHNGGVNGFSSALFWIPEEKVTVAVLSNALPPPPGTNPDEIVPVAAGAFLGQDMVAHTPQVDPTVDPKTYPEYVGRYDYGQGVQEITTENGHLYGQLTGQQRFEVFPSGPDAFFFKITPAALVFQRDAQNQVIAIHHIQGVLSFIAPKLPANLPTLSDPALDAFVGQYQYGPGAVLTVSRRDHQLYAQLTGQGEAPIFPTSDHEFTWKIVPARVEFIVGPDGKVIKAIHHQNGTSFNAPRLPSN